MPKRSAVIFAVIMALSVGHDSAWPRDRVSATPEAPGSGLTPGLDHVPRSIGPFEVANPDSTRILRLQVAAQVRLRYQSIDKGDGQCRDDDLFMEVRRLRQVLTLRLPQQRLSFRAHLSTTPRSLELMDLYFNYAFRTHLQFRFGQFKVPFGRYRIQSFQRLTFTDWAIVSTYFGAERQMGFAWHNGYEKPPGWAYAAGVFTGVNARASHGIGVPTVYGEPRPNPSDLADPAALPPFHPELFCHVAYNTNGIRVQSDSDPERSSFCYSVSASVAWDVDPVRYQDFVVRLAPEVLIKYRGFSFFTIGYAGFVETGQPEVTRLGMLGGLAQTAYRITDRCETSLRYAVVDPEDDLVDDAYSRARSLLAGTSAGPAIRKGTHAPLAPAQPDADYERAGMTLKEQEITAGFNIYFFEHSLKLQNDFGWNIRTRRDEKQVDFTVRSQFQVLL